MLGMRTTANITQRTSYEIEDYLNSDGIEPEKRLWVAVILSLFVEFEDTLRKYGKADLNNPLVLREFTHRKNSLIRETNGVWFKEICWHVGISPDHIRSRLIKMGESA